MRNQFRASVTLLAVFVLAGASAPALGGEPCVLLLANEDQLRGEIDRLAEGKLYLRPAVAPETTMVLEVEKVQRVTFERAREERTAPGAEMLKLWGGALLYGKFLKLTDECLHFDIEGVGLAEIRRDALVELSKTDSKSVRVADGGRQYETVVITQGDVLSGNLAQEPNGLLAISGAAVEARFAYESVASIFFAVSDESPPPPMAKQLRATATIVNGSIVGGSHPRIEEGRLSVTLLGGPPVALPLEQVLEVTFSSAGGLTAERGILVWGCYGDRKEEFVRTLDALKAHFGARWRVVENFADRFDEEFKQSLFRSRALVIPEMERWNSSRAGKLASELKPLADSFLRRGGNVVLLGVTRNQTNFLKEAGLLDVQWTGDISGLVRFTEAGRRIAEGIGDSFQATNSTQLYSMGGSIKASSLADYGSGSVIIARKVGTGWVILLGMDYYEHNEQTRRLLINAVTYR